MLYKDNLASSLDYYFHMDQQSSCLDIDHANNNFLVNDDILETVAMETTAGHLYDDLYSYHISPSLALESTFLVDSLAERETDLQKILVKDVFFSQAITEPTTDQVPASSASSSQTGDDNYSLVSFTSSSSSCSPAYQYEDIDNLIFSDNKEAKFPSSTEEMDQHSFLYGVDLYQPLPEEDDVDRTIVKKQRSVIKKNVPITKKKPFVHKKSKRSDYSDKISKKSIGEHKKSDSKSMLHHALEHTNKDYLNSLENEPRSVSSPTLYQTFSKQSIDWCRYCGTTEGVNWRPGPWGKRTLCNKHGCDYKGYGFACKLPRLDLTAFEHETIDKRHRPVLQLFCSQCHQQTSWEENTLVFCDGCPKSYHRHCYHHGPEITDDLLQSNQPWYCSDGCENNVRYKKVVVELPRKKLPLMRTPKDAIALMNNNTSC